MLNSGQSAMSASEVLFIGTKDKVTLEMSDNGGDNLIYDITDDITCIDDSPHEFKCKFPVKLASTLFKYHQNGYFELSLRGMAYITVNGITTIMLPRS